MSDAVERGVAVALIAERVKKAGESEIDVRNRVSHAIGYAIRHGRLGECEPGKFVFGHVVNWARARPKWRDRVVDFPQAHYENHSSDQGVAGDRVHDHIIPGDLVACQQHLRDACRRIAFLESEIEAAQKELDALRPIAEVAARRKQIGRESGRKGGRGKQR